MTPKTKALKKKKGEKFKEQNYIYTNGDSPEQAELRKHPYPAGDKNK